MSEKQNQLKPSKAQNNDIFNDEERNISLKTSKIASQTEVLMESQTLYIDVSTHTKQAKLVQSQTKPINKQSFSLQEIKQSKQDMKVISKEDQLKVISKEDQLQIQESIIPLSHGKRQKSLSPIKNQYSIASNQHFPISGPKMSLALMPKVQLAPQQTIKSEVKSSNSYLLLKAAQICNQPDTQSFRKQFNQRGRQSIRRSHQRRKQIFSSDKKNGEKHPVLGKNQIAEQILNQNMAQRGEPSNFYLKNDAYIFQTQKEPQKVENHSPINKKSRIQSFETLTNNKQKQIQKLQEIFGSPQKASLQYWQSIYPQSKKYLSSLISVLAEQKKVLQNWLFDLHSTLRESIFQVQESILQKMYQICRLTVKRWAEEEIQALQGFCNQKFAYFSKLKQNIQKKERDLEAVQKAFQSFQTINNNSIERSRVYRLIEGTILSSDYTDQISRISVKVKDLISKSEQVALQFCSDKLQKSKQLVSFQYDNDKYRLDKMTYELLKALFKSPETHKQEIKKQSKKLVIPDMKIGDRIHKILQKSQIRYVETARQASFSEFSQNRLQLPISSQKENIGGLKIRKKQQEYEQEQFQSEFQMRKKNFVGGDFSVYGQDKKPYLTPISHKAEKNGEFQIKLSSLLKKINDQKVQQNQEHVKNVANPKNYNQYQQLLRKKKQANRQNFFRYSMQ